MDQFLAEYYGTEQDVADGVADDDIEKMAQLTLLTKEAAAEGVDLTEFSDEELVAMADDLYGGGGVETAEADLEKEAAAKFEEADFLGRVMAHSFNQESVEIQKEAGKLERAGTAIEGGLSRVYGAAKRTALRGAGAVQAAERATAERLGRAAYGKKDLRAAAAKRAQELTSATTGLKPGSARELKDLAAVETLRRRGRIVGGAAAGGVGAAGAGGGIYAGTREKKSADSAFEQLVVDRANEHLQAAGLLEKEATGDDFETIVDRAALELLEANGHAVEWY